MNIFLIHGGWQGGWCWDGVVSQLERQGHRAIAITLPGLSPDAADRTGVGLAKFVEFATEQLETRDLRDVVIVAHSGGGPVAQGVVERAADRIRLVIYMSATVLLDGERLLDLGDAAKAARYAEDAAGSPDHTISMPEEKWITELCSDMTETQARSWLPLVVRCPFDWVQEAANLPAARWREKPSAYIFLDGEKPSANALYARMAGRLTDPFITHCPGSHEAMLSCPADVAQAILRAASSQAA
jgi:pimeloyl-ACP methyl ester carboxylesterase